MLDNRDITQGRLGIGVLLVSIASLVNAQVAGAQELDGSWTVAVNGQTVQVDPDGSFVIPNIPAPDLFGPDGPGTRPDFLSDDFLRVVGFSTTGGTTQWVYSTLFQISQGESFNVKDFTFSASAPPFPESIRVTADANELLFGQSAQLTVLGHLLDGMEIDVTDRSAGTVYRTSNPALATISGDGLLTAHRRGTVLITVVHVNTTAIKRIEVISELVDTTIEGFVQLPDKTPVQGAQVTLAEFEGRATTDATGHFAIVADVAVEVKLKLAVAAQVEGQAYTGSKQGLSVVADGFTDAGIIALVPSFTGDVPDLLFDNPEYAVGRGPLSVVFGDLNGDGTPDAATCTRDDSTVAVLLNAGDAIFTEAVSYDVAVTPLNVVMADLDDDGDLDLAVVSQSAFVTVLLNTGNGTFADPPSQYALPTGGLDLVTGDLNGDGDVDIATSNRRETGKVGTISFLYNNGDGSFFVEPVSFPVGLVPQSLAIGDLDGDQDLDLAVGNFLDQTVSFVINEGKGLFSEGTLLELSDRVLSVVIDDFNGNGDADLAVLAVPPTFGSGQAHVYIGDGKGGFAEPVTMDVERASRRLRHGDIDNDGDFDLVVPNDNSNNGLTSDLVIFVNDGDGTFSDVLRSPPAEEPRDTQIVDLDGDGLGDLASVNGETEGRIALIHNNGDGTFGPARVATGFDAAEGCGESSIAMGDWNDDGLLDTAAVASCGGNNVAVLMRNEDGSLAEPVTYAVTGKANAVASGDFNGDDDLDLAVAGDGGNVSILLNQGDGTFKPADDLTVTARPLAIAAGHLNSDNNIDLMTASSTSNSSSDTVSVFHGNGDGTFGEPLTLVSSNAAFVAIADANGDLRNDLVVGRRSGNANLAVLLRNPDDTFADPLEANAPLTAPKEMAVGDLDGDGDLDVVFVGNRRNVSVLLGHGDGSFADGVRYRYGANHGISSVVIGDLNGDGLGDIVAGNERTHSVRVLFGQADGTVVLDRFYCAGFAPSALAIGDVEDDGDLDLVIHSSPNTSLLKSGASTLFNRRNPQSLRSARRPASSLSRHPR